VNRRELLFVLAAFAIASAAFLWVRAVQLPLLRGPAGHYVLSDPDSFVRWRLVERAIAGEGARIRWMNEENAPYGHLNAWTSPMTILGVALVQGGEWFGGKSRPDALEIAGVWLGPLVGLTAIIALGALGWRTGGWLLAACWMLAWPALIDVISITGFGNTDHHSLHQLLFICVVGGCLAWSSRPTPAGGIFVGLSCAVLIWSAGLEALPVWALAAGLAFYELCRRAETEEVAEFWRAWWMSGLLGTAAAWIFEFWPNVFHGRLEFISVWHVTLWALLGAVLEFASRPRLPLRWKMLALATGMVIALLAAGAVRGFDWRHLHIVQDERLKRLMSVTTECMPYPRSLPDAIQHGCIDFGFLPLLALALALMVGRLNPRSRWLVVVVILYGVLTFFQVRWLDFLVPALVMAAGVALTRLHSQDPLVCIAAIVLATIPSWIVNLKVAKNMKLAKIEAAGGPFAETFALCAMSECLEELGEKPVVLAPWEESSILAGLGKARVIGSGFWSNLDGLADTFEMFTTASKARFWELVKKRNVRYALLRSPDRLEIDIRQSFVAAYGRAPTRSEVETAYIWQLRDNEQFPAVLCLGMTRVEPQWELVNLAGNEFRK
jgi:hypothetical protein